MKLNLIRALTIAGMLASAASAHALNGGAWWNLFFKN
jgi:hypothetical protein